MEGIGDQIGEAIGEGRWLTYTELAEIRGIGRESAVKLAQRERWRKMAGNSPDRTVRVFVPEEWLKPAKGGQTGEAIPEGFGEFSRLVSSFQDTIAFVRERAEAAEARADQAEADRRAAEARADAERERADVALAVADRALAQLAEAVARADRLDLLLETEWGRIVTVEAKAVAAEQRAEAAEQGRDRAEADIRELRAHATALQGQLADAQKAAQTAGALRQAETDRKSRGIVERLRAAWRGE